ncbi:hypothetical protein RRG08_028113 [Elysia crispata]|uniref:Lysosome-associated membrane glycoprotein 5 n=1 Tax=Elysia crispata TaxID=231223 RepID=A0AAE1A3T3_9GAST|nr:hypothetical protein RRG08_028113 [Elysia crispata]
MNRKTSTDFFVVVMGMGTFLAAFVGGAHTLEDPWSNTTIVETPSVNITGIEVVNASIAQPEVEANANFSHILVVNSKSGQPCLLAALNATIQVSYKVLEGIVHESYVTTEDIQLPEDVTAQGVCGENRSHLLLEWGNGTFHLNLTFSLKESNLALQNSTWSLTAISVSYDLSNSEVFPASSEASLVTYEKSDLSLFTTELGHAYACDRDITVIVGTVDKGVVVKFHNIKLAAFGVTSSEFPDATDYCTSKGDADNPENVLVPLIVACCLSAVVIIIVIGYVISRVIQRKREQSDYRAM